ncbi:MAG: hypothetical protein KDI30_07890 [Pseudomonadales bacterium]|nr:hypothetical protein [Pseudomonadales bacterium]
MNAAELLAGEFASRLGRSAFEQFQQTLSELHHRFYQLERSLLSGNADAVMDVNGYEQAGRIVMKKLQELEAGPEGHYRNLLETVVVNGREKLQVSTAFLAVLSELDFTGA